MFNSFPIIWAMTEGGPGFETSTTTLFMYKLAVQNDRLGPSAAMAIVNLGLVFIVVLRLPPSLALEGALATWWAGLGA